MSKLDLVQLGSNHLAWSPLFSTFQQLGATTTLQAFPTGLAIPIASAGSGSANPIGIIDNRKVRATTLLLAFGVTSTNASKLKLDVTAFNKIVATSYYLPTKLFLGEAKGSAFDLSTYLSQASAFGCDQFDLKTFAFDGVAYIEPADGLSMAILRCDMRGAEYVAVRLAQGVATAAAYGQVFYGFN
jgi:hypothetical protein